MSIHAGLYGQFFSGGETPASIRWCSMTTPHFVITFPEEVKMDALIIANELEYYKQYTEEKLQYKFKKLPILLHNTSVLSNGFVSLAPQRMELVATPPQDGYAQPWLSQLALHEFRHAVQLGTLQQGFSKALYFGSGEIGAGAVSSILPRWFYEGDAVSNETRLSCTGRGRIPGFAMPLRAQLMQNAKIFSYDKATFGSYRDFVPSPYLFGYQITEFARKKYGEEFWPNAVRYTARNSYLLSPLAIYFKKETGVFKGGLYTRAMNILKEQYNNSKDTIIYRKYLSKYSIHREAFTHYTLPKDIGKGRYIALKSGLTCQSAWVILDSIKDREDVLLRTGYTNALRADLHDEILVWDEVHHDPRWAGRSYSVIRMLNVVNGRNRYLTKRTRFFSPDVSPNGNLIAVIETDLENRNFLCLLSAKSGKIEARYESNNNQALQMPEWISETELAVITVGSRGKQLEVFDIRKAQWRVLLPATWIDISEPVNFKKYIFIRGSFKGLENIYAIQKAFPFHLYQVTFSEYGAYHPSVSEDSTKLLFSDYTSKGFDVASICLDTILWKEIPYGKESFCSVAKDSLPILSYHIKRYHKAAHLFKFHSWLPFYADPDQVMQNILEINIMSGITLFSQNLLSNVISSVGYGYDQGQHGFYPSVSWRAWYPVVELKGRFATNTREGIIRVYVPLLFDKGRSITYLQPEFNFEYIDMAYRIEDRVHRGLNLFHYRLYAQRYSRMSIRDLYPRWGQQFSGVLTHAANTGDNFGHIWSVQTGAFFPGFFMNHHIYTKAGYQVQKAEDFYLPINRVPFSRGYTSAISGSFLSLSANYAMPLFYPDWSLGPLLYLQRLRLNVFCDWSFGKDIREVQYAKTVSFTGNYSSMGGEITADLHLFRIIFPLAVGIRVGYLPASKMTFAEMLVNVRTTVFQ
jgi:hypothetical protein